MAHFAMSDAFMSKAECVLLYEAYDSNPNASSFYNLEFVDEFRNLRSASVYYVAEKPRLVHRVSM